MEIDDLMDDEMMNVDIPSEEDVSNYVLRVLRCLSFLSFRVAWFQLRPEWKRPPVKNLDPATDAITFQQLTIDHIQGTYIDSM